MTVRREVSNVQDANRKAQEKRQGPPTVLGTLGQVLLHLGLVLGGLAVAALQPALRRLKAIVVLVLAQGRQKLSQARHGHRAALLGRVVDGLHPAQGRARREKREQLVREFVGHGGGAWFVVKERKRKGEKQQAQPVFPGGRRRHAVCGPWDDLCDEGEVEERALW